MAQFLSDAWLSELDAAARTARPPSDMSLVIQQVVVDDAEPEVAYALRIRDGAMSVAPGRVDDADVTFTQDRDTARSIAEGSLSAQAAFMSGKLRMGGDLRDVLERSTGVVDLDDLFASVRASTQW